MCRFDVAGDWRDRGYTIRHLFRNLAGRASRMHTASAIVSIGRLAWLSMVCTTATEGSSNERPEGNIRVRWTAEAIKENNNVSLVWLDFARDKYLEVPHCAQRHRLP